MILTPTIEEIPIESFPRTRGDDPRMEAHND